MGYQYFIEKFIVATPSALRAGAAQKLKALVREREREAIRDFATALPSRFGLVRIRDVKRALNERLS